jgi:MSHA pilin protein MshC
MRSDIRQTLVDKRTPGTGGENTAFRPYARGGRARRGFTLIELVTVMVIVGILAVSVLPRFFTVSDFEDRGSADQVKSLLRFAQKTAIAQHRAISVGISGGAATPNCTTTLTGGNLTCEVKSATANKTVTFDALGRPVPNAADAVTVGGTSITIEAETGYVH